MNPAPGFNLKLEQKDAKGSKKADGAILVDEKVTAVIELKGMDTTDLDKVEPQAFGYKNYHRNANYVVISNFEKLRFYIDNAVEHLEFNLFELSKEDFKVLWLCLAQKNIEAGLPKKIKDASLTQEDIITKELYKDYSQFKHAIFDSIVKHNPDYDRLRLFKKTQKLLDRFLFIFFAEDQHLLPPNSIRKITKQWQDLRDEYDMDVTLYQRFKKYFGYLNTGHRGKEHEIFAYNGGLFEEDEILDNITLDDEILYKHTLKISKYDFASDVDVNILGHIFEHSLNEIEEISAEIKGEEIDTSKTRRKKDGVFYTPKYITKYIVENTVGKLCDDKKAELEIVGERFTEAKRRTKKGIADLQEYRDWLLSLTICDPACGSGAFLNQALEYLIEEHKYIDELQAKYHGEALVLSDIENQILENNLFGVDINEESVEIAKLSLWLRTAQKGRKLTSLNNNIKCGNSLIDDPDVAGDKAFNWEEEFPTVFENGGFDVVIGNPPYVSAMDLKKFSSPEEYQFLKDNFDTAKGAIDLYIYFFEKGIKINKKSGYLAYITPNRYLSASYGNALREYILIETKLCSLIDYSDKKVFPDASTYPVITILQRGESKDYDVLTGKFDDETKLFEGRKFPSSRLGIIANNILGFLLNDKLPITEKVINQSVNLSEVGKINATSTAREADEYSDLINEDSGYKLVNTGTIDPYLPYWGYDELTNKGSTFLTPYLPKDNPEISDNRNNLYNSPKIIIAKIGLKCEAFYDRDGEFASINTNCIHSFNENYLAEYILCFLNSKLYNYTFECLFDGLRMSGGYLLYSAPNLKNTYIKHAPISFQEKFIPLSKDLEKHWKELLELTFKFNSLVLSKFDIDKLSRKLQNWHELTFKQFLAELKKKKVKLSLSQEAEWMEYFNEQKKKAEELKAQIAQTDKEIDALVYELYGLSEEEIEVVEGS
jgi:type I restriction-modification system DNA methylase subunit